MSIKENRTRLERQAREMAEKIGHQMSDFATYAEDGTRASSEAYCLKCGMAAQANANAQPQLQICGAAPRFDCRGGQ